MERSSLQVRVVEHAELFRAIDHVADAIRSGELPPGARIRDARLAAELGIPRALVRVALRELEQHGLVRETRTRFYRVTEPAPNRFQTAMECVGLEIGIALQLALPKMDVAARADLSARLRRAARICARPGVTAEAVYAATFDLFDEVVARTGNPFLRTSFDRAGREVQRSMRGEMPLLNPPSIIGACAAEVARAVDEGDARRADRALRRMFRPAFGRALS
ncbi:GntR family transcriptional regulator [Microbacterium oryzae]|uniref:GntR family transcriptional regulator n=1 Tax=Microbacterium oryzae TaxID=743009 RepID=UPI0025B03E7E|nr:GntR family transcriptional regulator [Microbacterium oryzae]MDN3311554.1 GntR family transcriptional regulator [Microbacterium oryzae]